MKVLIFKGSPRAQGNTNTLEKILADELRQSGAEVTEINLPDLEIRPCTACRWCQKDWSTAACVQQDDLNPLLPQILASDLLILATPIYSWYCTPPMKALLDRLVYALNMYYGDKRGPSLWKGKNLALLLTCGYRPEKGTDLFEEGMKRYCRHSQLHYCGAHCERHLGYNTVFLDQEKTERTRTFAQELLRIGK